MIFHSLWELSKNEQRTQDNSPTDQTTYYLTWHISDKQRHRKVQLGIFINVLVFDLQRTVRTSFQSLFKIKTSLIVLHFAKANHRRKR